MSSQIPDICWQQRLAGYQRTLVVVVEIWSDSYPI